MPAAALIGSYQALELSLASTVSYTITGSPPNGGDASSTAKLQTWWATSSVLAASGVTLEVSAGKQTGTWGVKYFGPNQPFGGFVQTGSVGGGGWSISISARFLNVRLYALDPGTAATWRLYCDAIEIYVNGGLSTTLAGFVQTGFGLGPQYVPFFAVHPTVEGQVAATGGTDVGNYSWAVSADHTVSGGIRFLVDGIWVSDPVTPDTPVEVAASGSEGYPPPFGLGLSGIVVSTATYGDHLNLMVAASAERAVCPVPPGIAMAPATLSGETTVGKITLIPNRPHEIRRIDPDNYRAMYLRYGLPGVTASATREWYEGPLSFTPPGPIKEIATAAPIVYASQPQMLATVDGSPHVIEDPLGWTLKAPIEVAHSKSVASNDSTACSDPAVAYDEVVEESVGYVTLSEVETLDANPQLAGYLHHASALLRFATFIGHRLWSYFYASFPWLIGGGAASPLEYWYKVRQQHLYHASLPEDERPATRNQIILSAHEESGHTPFLDALVAELRWIGVWGWKTRTVTVPPAIAYDQEHSYDREGCDVDVTDGTWTITPDANVTGCSFKLEIADSDHWPYYAAAFGDRIKVDWPEVVGVQIKVWVVGRDGQEYLLRVLEEDEFTTPGITYDLLRLPQAKYAGDWAQDHGVGYLADAGADLQPEGMSAAILPAAENATIFGLLAGMTPDHLRFELYFEDAGADPVLMDSPVIYASESVPSLWWNTAAHACWLMENGPGPRWPNIDTYEIGNLDPMQIRPLGYKSTAIDGMRLARLFEGRDRYDDETAEIEEFLDAVEGRSVGAADRATLAVPLPPVQERRLPIALINTLKEVPPLLLVPPLERDEEWETTGERKMVVWAWDQEPRYLISAGEKADMYDQTGTKITSDVLAAPEPWFVTKHLAPTNGSETLDARIRTESKQWASVRVWHGYYSLLHLLEEILGDVHLTRLPLGQVAAVFARETGLTVWVVDHKGTNYSHEVSPDVPISAQIAHHPSGELVVVAAFEDGQIRRYASWSLGRRWQEPEVLAFTGTQVAAAIDPLTGIEYIAAWETDGYYLFRRMSKNSDWQPRGVIVSCDECRGGLEVSNDDANRLVFVIDGVRRFSSVNGGRTWIEHS